MLSSTAIVGQPIQASAYHKEQMACLSALMFLVLQHLFVASFNKQYQIFRLVLILNFNFCCLLLSYVPCFMAQDKRQVYRIVNYVLNLIILKNKILFDFYLSIFELKRAKCKLHLLNFGNNWILNFKISEIRFYPYILEVFGFYSLKFEKFGFYTLKFHNFGM